MENQIKAGPPVPPMLPKPLGIPIVPAVPLQNTVTEELVIRTMQDDLSAQGGHSVPAPKANIPISNSVPIKVQTIQQAKTAQQPSILPKPKVVLVPQAVKRHNIVRNVLVLVVIAVVLAGAGAAGAWWWFYGRVTTSKPAVTATNNASAPEILPADASLIIQYKLTSADDRTAVLTAWNKRSETPDMTSLLSGDPRLVLQDASVSEFYYVLLSNEPRPFFVVPKTTSTAQLLDSNSGAQVTEKSGWYIAHSVGTDSYISDLNQKTLASIGSDTVLTTTTEQAPIRVIAGPGSLMKWREALGGSNFANGQLQELSFASRFVSNGTGLEVSGLGVPLSEPAAGASNQQLLSLVPATASLVRLGANFSDDLTKWSKTASSLDMNALAQTNVQTLLGQLNTPYAFFVNSDDQGNHSYGVVITLPSNLSPALATGDSAVESGLGTLVPLLTGKQSVVPLAFSDGSRNNMPLRYVNLDGTISALDYTVNDKYLEIATSRDNMFTMMDALAGNTDSTITSATKYSQLFSLWGALPNSRDVVLGMLSSSSFKDLLPIDENTSQFPFGLTLHPADDGKNITVQGVVQLSSSSDVQSESNVVESPSPSPSPVITIGQ